MAGSNQRRNVLYSGSVQGVGFRYTTRQIAARFAVCGFVRNLADGRVELVAEGSASELDELLAAIAEAMSGYIRDVQVEPGAATSEFTGFEIRF